MSKAQEFRDYVRMRPHMRIDRENGQVKSYVQIRMTDDGGLELTREVATPVTMPMPWPTIITLSPEETDVVVRWFFDTFGDEAP